MSWEGEDGPAWESSRLPKPPLQGWWRFGTLSRSPLPLQRPIGFPRVLPIQTCRFWLPGCLQSMVIETSSKLSNPPFCHSGPRSSSFMMLVRRALICLTGCEQGIQCSSSRIAGPVCVDQAESVERLDGDSKTPHKWYNNRIGSSLQHDLTQRLLAKDLFSFLWALYFVPRRMAEQIAGQSPPGGDAEIMINKQC